jgi:hypothetical protein
VGVVCVVVEQTRKATRLIFGATQTSDVNSDSDYPSFCDMACMTHGAGAEHSFTMFKLGIRGVECRSEVSLLLAPGAVANQKIRW